MSHSRVSPTGPAARNTGGSGTARPFLSARWLSRWALFTVVLAAVVFGLAGRLDLARLWALVALLSIFVLVTLSLAHPDLAKERFRPPTRGADPVALQVIRVLGAAMAAIAIVDVGRFHFSDTMAFPARLAGFVLLAAGLVLVSWAMIANPFFSAVVRIQADRGHRVIRAGPYQYIRHPGYLGMAVAVPAIPMALGSWLGLAAGLGYTIAILRRAGVEDRYLRQHLDGYADYARAVRFRVLPGVW